MELNRAYMNSRPLSFPYSMALVWEYDYGFMRDIKKQFQKIAYLVRKNEEAPFGLEECFFLDFKIVCITAQTLFKSGIYASSFLPSAKDKFLITPVASDRDFVPMRQLLSPLCPDIPTPSIDREANI